MRYMERQRSHTLLYAVSLGLFSLAAAADAWARLTGVAPEILYRLYWFAAAGLVGMMAAATGTLMVPFMDRDLMGRLGRWVTSGTVTVLLGLMAWLLFEVLRMPVSDSQLLLTVETFTRAPGTFIPPSGPKFPFVLTNSLGTVLIICGALWSFWKTRAIYTLTIALGALIFALGGTAANLGGEALFYASQVAGTLVLNAGVHGSIQQRPVVAQGTGRNA